jgi:hypothetical protein
MPNMPAINTTGRPELVLSPQQLDTMTAASGSGNPSKQGGDTFRKSSPHRGTRLHPTVKLCVVAETNGISFPNDP